MSERQLKVWQDAGLIDADIAERIRAWELEHSWPVGLWAIVGLGASTIGLGDSMPMSRARGRSCAMVPGAQREVTSAAIATPRRDAVMLMMRDPWLSLRGAAVSRRWS